jgi:hypothetical protein
MKEFVVWGIPTGDTEEQPLYTKAPTRQRAEEIATLIESRGLATSTRIQELDLSTPPNFAETLC